MTVRQLYYRLTTQGAIAKTESGYKVVKRLTAEMRRSGEIPFQWLADATRWMRRPTTYSSVEDALQRTASTYRRSLWDGEGTDAVEIWLEKDALAGVLVDVTDEWDVPLMVTRGYPSLSFLHSAAAAIDARYEKNGRRTHIYYFGDHDPSGVDIDRKVVEGIGESLLAMEGTFADDVDDHDRERAFEVVAAFKRVAVTPAQISAWNLPTRPTKPQDSRSKGFRGASAEVDAIPPAQLRQLAEQVIEQHVDPRQLDVLKVAEAEERKVLEGMAGLIEGPSGEAS